MTNPLNRSDDRIGLLVSVRDVAEAEAALHGGADVIDVKEPTRGSLGTADAESVAVVVAAVAGRAPVSVALGELRDWSASDLKAHLESIGDGVAFGKFGLAGCRGAADWPERWRRTIAILGGRIEPVAVVYADWHSAAAPAPEEVLAEARASGCAVLLVDTWDKTGGTLLDRWPIAALDDFSRRVRDARLALVLAGSLAGAQLTVAARCRPALVAVRAAACDGGRDGRVSLERVSEVRAAIDSAAATCREASAAVGSN